MRIEEAKQKASELNNPAVNKVLEYVDYLETRLADMHKISKSHQELVGGLITQTKER